MLFRKEKRNGLISAHTEISPPSEELKSSRKTGIRHLKIAFFLRFY